MLERVEGALVHRQKLQVCLRSTFAKLAVMFTNPWGSQAKAEAYDTTVTIVTTTWRPSTANNFNMSYVK